MASNEGDSTEARVLDGPEAQLIQESLSVASKRAASQSALARPQISAPVPQPVEVKQEPSRSNQPSATEKLISPSTSPNVKTTAGSQPSALTAAAPTEIPDSQDSASADRMDVDPPTAAPPQKEMEAVKLPSQSTVPPTANSADVMSSSRQMPADAAHAPERAVTRVSTGAIRQKRRGHSRTS
ncbi:hypothetical protein HYQ46_013002 [Verticillium longisporum]|nr:hypothetical protein HYQ46_013002 [Verticillium longisporum]